MDSGNAEHGYEISRVSSERLLSKSEFQRLGNVPPEAEWFANLANTNTRRAYRNDVGSFMRFVGINSPQEFRSVRRAHGIAWRKQLEKEKLAAATIRRKLAALSDLFNYLCEKNAVLDNPTHGVARPKEGANEGKTPALSDAQAAALLAAPQGDALKDKRDRAILAVLLFHAVRRAELCGLRVKDFSDRKGVRHFRVHGKGGKVRYIPAHPRAVQLLEEYFDVAGHRWDQDGWLFRPATKLAKHLQSQLSADSIYRNVVMHHCKRIGIAMELLGPHVL